MCAALLSVFVRPEDECSSRDDSIDSWAHIAGHIEVDKSIVIEDHPAARDEESVPRRIYTT